MKGARGRGILSLAIVLACCARAFALDPSLDISQYAHTSWKIRDGLLKSPVRAIAQTPDGYLWLGTDAGLVRFDGVRFVDWHATAGQSLPGGRVRSLLAASDGALWIGTDEGLASWKEGQVTQYPELAGQLVVALLEDHDGTVWAGGVAAPSGRLCQCRDGKIRCYGEDGSLGGGIGELLQDSSGNLWAGGGKRLWRWKPGRSELYTLSDTMQGLAEDEKGQLLISTIQSGLRVLAGDKIRSYTLAAAGRQTKFGQMFRDHDRGMWIGTFDRGLFHIHGGKTDVFSQTDGVTSNFILKVFEDREGNIWVGTTDGLDRFREFSLPTISVKEGLSPSSVSSVLTAKDGSIWMGTYAGLNRWTEGKNTIFVHERTPDSVEREVVDTGLPDNYIESLWEDPEHKIWVFTRRGLAVFDNGHFKSEAGLGSNLGWVHSVAGQGGTGSWVSTSQALLHVRDQKIAERIHWQEFGKMYPALSLMLDPSGGVYLGFEKGGLAYFKDGAVRSSYSEKNGLGKGHVFDLYMDRGGAVWAATQGGLSRVSGGHVATLSSKNGLPCDSALWMREDDTGAAWLYMSCGLVHIAPSELQGWVSDPNKVISSRVYDASDGIATHATSTSSSPNVTMSNDGKLWFTTWDGVTVIDPHHLAFNKLAPPVHIEKIVADDKTYDEPGNGVRLATGVRYLTIDYTALSLVAPEKVHFRYKLEGQDKDWREVVNDREVQYSNLAPKRYRFRVLASNNSGVWNEEGAAVEFVIPPAWYQTSWFYAGCAAAFLASLWAAYQLRVRQLAAEFNVRLDERVAERSRIARDLHDTLLQSFQGLVLRFQAAVNLLPNRPEKAQEVLEGALEAADQAIAEGRGAIQQLRTGSSNEGNLEQMLLAMGRELALSQNGGDSAPALRVIVEGQRRAKRAMIREEIYRIARELLRNAYKHSRARNIEAELRYDEDAFLLVIRDDGKGIDAKVLKDRGRAGHWGLPGMYERAEGMGARLDIWSEVGAGTEVRLMVPGAIAYQNTASGSRLNPFRKTRNL